MALCIEYEDSSDLIQQADFNYAVSLMDEGNYSDAKAILVGIKDYSGAQDKIYECEYNLGLASQDKGDYLAAAKSYRASSGFHDANDRIMTMGEQLVEKQDYSTAWVHYILNTRSQIMFLPIRQPDMQKGRHV